MCKSNTKKLINYCCVAIIVFMNHNNQIFAQQVPNGWKLIWQDEFENSTLDKNKWTVYIGPVYNNEKQNLYHF